MPKMWSGFDTHGIMFHADTMSVNTVCTLFKTQTNVLHIYVHAKHITIVIIMLNVVLCY